MPPATPPTQSAPWLAHYPTDVPPTTPVPEGNLSEILTDAARQWPKRTAIGFFGRTWTYAQTLTLAQQVAAALRAENLAPGARVALCLPNCPAYVAGFFGTLLAGGVVVNLNPLYTTDELHHMLKDSGAEVVLGLQLEPVWSKLTEACKNTNVRVPVAVDLASFMPWPTALGFRLLKVRTRVRRLAPGVGQWGRWLQPPTTHPMPAGGAHMAVLQYTGGTTGTPKAAMLSHANLRGHTEQMLAWLGQPEPNGEVIIGVLPLFHIFALASTLLLGVRSGAALHLLPQFNLAQFLKLVRRVSPTMFSGVPGLFNAVAGSPLAAQIPCSSLKFCISGGAPLPQVVKDRFETLTGAKVVEGYGLTEASPVVACGPRGGLSWAQALPAPAGSVGLPLPGTHVQIRSAENPAEVLAIGETGEIWVRGPQVMAGYWQNPAATADVLQNGWLRTGDAGHLDEQGYLFVTDRLKDIIFVNGYKVFPRQVEEVLAKMPQVSEVAVVPAPDTNKGEMSVAFVSLKPADAPVDEAAARAAIQAFAVQHLNKLQVPAKIVILPTLPKTPVGKIDKKPLKQAVQTFAASNSTLYPKKAQ